MKEKIEGLLFVCETSLNANKGENAKIFEHIIFINNMFSITFPGNPNALPATEYFYEIMSSYMNESEVEFLFFEKAVKYLDYLLDHLSEVDEEILIEIDEGIDYLEDLFTTRILSTVQVFEHYKGIIESGILTNSNYYITNFSDRFDEDEKNKLLACIPEV